MKSQDIICCLLYCDGGTLKQMMNQYNKPTDKDYDKLQTNLDSIQKIIDNIHAKCMSEDTSFYQLATCVATI